ncbi:MAG TPA: hypothetical protein VGR57_18695 [Ktedonobacterales bacterium]|nr:hypothetical protein [Ktedonobacterales bacterium]
MAEAKELPARGPGGVGTGVAIDWGLTVQFLTMAVLQVLHSAAHVALPAGALVIATASAPALVGTLLAYLVLAALFFALGERLRRGGYVAWRLQLGFAVLLLLVGIATLVRVVGDLRSGQRPAIASAVVLLVINPVAVWLLAQPRTRAWFRAITPPAAAARHGGRWLAEIAAFALVGGIAVALGL